MSCNFWNWLRVQLATTETYVIAHNSAEKQFLAVEETIYIHNYVSWLAAGNAKCNNRVCVICALRIDCIETCVWQQSFLCAECIHTHSSSAKTPHVWIKRLQIAAWCRGIIKILDLLLCETDQRGADGAAFYFYT